MPAMSNQQWDESFLSQVDFQIVIGTCSLLLWSYKLREGKSGTTNKLKNVQNKGLSMETSDEMDMIPMAM